MKFHIGDILSVTTGKLLSPKRMEGVYEILDFLTGEGLYTHELPHASKFMTPYVLKQLPQLAEEDGKEVNPESFESCLKKYVKKYGEYLELKSCSGVWEDRDAMKDGVILDLENGRMIINEN